MLFIAIVALIVALVIFAAKARAKKLAAMTPDERAAFIAVEQNARDAQKEARQKRQEGYDRIAAAPGAQAILVAKTEGRS